MRFCGAILIAGLLAVAGLALPSPAAARTTCAPADWGVEGGGTAHTRYDCSAGHLNAPHYQVRWRRPFAGILEFPPAYADGRLYTGQDDGMLTAQSIDGTLLWHRWFFMPGRGRHPRPNPIVQTPTAWHGRLYFTTKTDHAVWCLDGVTGQTIWHVRHGGGEAAPVILSGPDGPTVYTMELSGDAWAIDADSGRIRWHEKVAGRTTASFTIAGGLLFDADYLGHVFALRPDGRVVWRQTYRWLSDYADIAYSRGHLILASRLGGVGSVNAANGRLSWYRQLDSGPVYGHPAVAGGAVYTAGYDGMFWKLAQRTGRVSWSRHVNRAIGGPVVLGNRVYFTEMGSRGRRGRIHAYQTRTMTQVWSFADGKYTAVTPAGGTLVAVGFTTLTALLPRG